MIVKKNDFDDIELLACISHLFRVERLRYLSDVLYSLYGLGVARLDAVVFTNTDDPAGLAVLQRLFSKFESRTMSVSISSHPEVNSEPRMLPWLHKALLKQKHADGHRPYTHYLYLEDDMVFSSGNLRYFLEFRPALKPFGLLPGMVRYEYNDTDHDVFTAGQLGRQDFVKKPRIICRDTEFVGLDEPYAAMFLLDREMMDEYLASRSFDVESSRGVVNWGSIQRSAMGLTWENVPAGFRNRNVVPLRSRTTIPDAMCWVRHLPGRYTNDYSDTSNFVLGKTRMDEIFIDFAGSDRQPPYISCYGTGDDPGYAISVIGELYPAASYRRPIPAIAASDAFRIQLERVCDDVNRTHHSAQQSLLVSLATAYVYGPVIYVEAIGEPALLLETHRFNDRRFVTAPHPRNILDTFEDFDSQPDSCAIFIGSAGSFNYGHWLVDDLPRLKAVHALRARFPTLKIRVLLSLLGDVIDAIRRESAQAYLSAIDNYTVEFLDCKIPYKIGNLFYASPVSLHPATKLPAAIAWVSEQAAILRRDALQGLPRSDRIFVTRRPPDGRILLNHEEIAGFLAGHGFIIVDMNGLSFSQQIDLFRDGGVIVGCMGAAMTNTILCRSPVTVVILAPEGWVEPFYWDLAAVRGDRYAACYGEPDNKDVPANASSYSIDVARLASVMGRLELLRRDTSST